MTATGKPVIYSTVGTFGEARRATTHATQLLAAQARYFRLLGDPTRLRILGALVEKERTVSELVTLAGAPRSRVSNHLACLKWCGIVEAERKGRHITYRVADPRVAELIALSRGPSAVQRAHLASCRRIGPEWI